MRWIERLRLTFKRLELRQASQELLAKHDEALVINLLILNLKLT
ncbi:nucleoside diphosphate kinase [Streptococcus pyogenes]|nr:nucleoside diphosphate kinase [Streptococcus pyogenes]